ncbi:MAG: tetratricopeptide repeat protein [Planctomycetota bacterium]
MHRLLARIGLALAGAAVLLAGCTTPQQEADSPGALPRAKLEVTPRLNASTHVAHGRLLEEQGKYDAAAAQYRAALELTPGLAAARSRLGVCLNQLGRHAEASAEFRIALQQAPHTAYLHNNYGFSLYLEGKYAEAEAALGQSVALQPNFPRAHMNRGLALARLERFEEALAEFALAVPKADAYYNLAVLQIEARRYTEATRALEQALKLNPEFAAAREALRDVSRRMAAEDFAEQAAAEAAHIRTTAETVAETAPEPVAPEPEAPADNTAGAEQPQPAIEPAEPAAMDESATPTTPDELSAADAAAAIRAQVENALNAALVQRQIDLALAGAEERPAELPDVSAARLMEMVREAIEAVVMDRPWAGQALDRLERLLSHETGFAPAPVTPAGDPAP